MSAQFIKALLSRCTVNADFTKDDYFAAVNDLAQEIADDAIRFGSGDDADSRYQAANELTPEHVDGTEWIIYTCNHVGILSYTNSLDDACEMCVGMEGDHLLQVTAAYAMGRDVGAVITKMYRSGYFENNDCNE